MTDTPDTSPEAVETLCGLLKHNRAWQGLQDVDRDAYDQAIATLCALAAERDALKARADIPPSLPAALAVPEIAALVESVINLRERANIYAKAVDIQAVDAALRAVKDAGG